MLLLNVGLAVLCSMLGRCYLWVTEALFLTFLLLSPIQSGRPDQIYPCSVRLVKIGDFPQVAQINLEFPGVSGWLEKDPG